MRPLAPAPAAAPVPRPRGLGTWGLVAAALALPGAWACARRRPSVPDAARAIDLPPRQAPPEELVVLLHGLGDSAAGFQQIGRALGEALPHAEVLVPDGFHRYDGGGSGRQWFSFRGVTDENRPARLRQAATEVSRWIDAELAARALAPERLAVIGFSQGAMVAAWLALHRTPRPAAVVMLSGRVAEDRPPTPASPGTRVLIAHGDRDAVISVANVGPAARALEAAGDRVSTHLYPGLGHQIDARELDDAAAFLAQALGVR